MISWKKPTHAKAWLLPFLLTGLAACQTESAADAQRDDIADAVARAESSARPSVAALFATSDVVEVTTGANTILVSDLLANDGSDADSDSFELVANESTQGAPLTLDNGEISYTADVNWSWDAFEYTVCHAGDSTDCETARVQLVIKDSANACTVVDLEETFKNDEPDSEKWDIGEDAALTSGATNGDPSGEGWLRLTPAEGQKHGYALFDEAFPSGDGVAISFEAAAWGGGTSGFGADGFVFFLVDGDAVDKDSFEIGGKGGSLGYAPRHNEPGMKHAVLGIGFDEWGNFWNGGEGRKGPEGNENATGRRQNSIALRAGADDDWRHLYDTNTINIDDLQIACPNLGAEPCDERPETLGKGRYLVHITIIPKGNNEYDISVYTRDEDEGEFISRIEETISADLPDNLKLGFSSGTGTQYNNHDIRTVHVQSLTDLSVETSVEAEEGFVDGRTVEYTYRIKNNSDSQVCAAEVELTLPEGFVIENGGQNCEVVAGTDGTTCGLLVEDGTLYDVIAIEEGAEIVITIRGTLDAGASQEGTASGRVTPAAGQGDLDPSDNFSEITQSYANPPTVEDHDVPAAAGKTTTIDVLEDAQDGDAPIDPESVTITNENELPDGVVVTVNPDGTIDVYIPEEVDEDFTIEYTVNDEDGLTSNLGNVDITVIQPPEGTPVEGTTVEETPIDLESPFPPEAEIRDPNITEGEGTVSYDSNTGEFTVTPDPGFTGTIIVEVEGCDEALDNACATSTITVEVLDAPTMEGGSAQVTPGKSVSISPRILIDSDLTLDGESLKIVDDSDAPNGTCSIVDGKVNFEADANVVPPVPNNICVAEICLDGVDYCTSASFEFEITYAFGPSDDEIGTGAGTPIEFTPEDLLENDNAIDEDTFKLNGTPDEDGVIHTDNGTITENEDGDGYTYTPNDGFTGEDSFSYNVCSEHDATDCDDVTVNVVVKEGPIDTTIWTVTGTPSIDADLTDNYDGEAIGSANVKEITADEQSGDDLGEITVNGDTLTFEPTDPDAADSYDITVEICGSEAPIVCQDATVTIVYNDPPVVDTPDLSVPSGESTTIPFDELVSNSNTGDIDGGWDESSIVVSNDPNGPFDEDAELEDENACSIIDGELVYHSDASAVDEDLLPSCFVRVCEKEPGPQGTDATDRACAVIELTPTVDNNYVPEDVKITGPANHGETTNKTPEVTGTGEPGTNVTITVDDEEQGTVPVDEDGNWTWTPDTPLEPGTKKITATDDNGSSDEITITIKDDEGAGEDDPSDGQEPDPDVALTGGRFLSCASQGDAGASAAWMLLLVGGLMIVRRRRTNAA